MGPRAARNFKKVLLAINYFVLAILTLAMIGNGFEGSEFDPPIFGATIFFIVNTLSFIWVLDEDLSKDETPTSAPV